MGPDDFFNGLLGLLLGVFVAAGLELLGRVGIVLQALLELSDGRTHRAGELRELRAAEEEHGDQADDQPLLDAPESE